MISVIIPSHNRINNLRKTLDALVNQTLVRGSFEVILVDDGSTDGTYNLVEEFKDKLQFKYAYIYKIYAWNASRPRNFGAKLAEGDVFLFVDSDVCLNPEALKAYDEDYKANQNRIVIGRYDWLPPEKEVTGALGHIGDDIRKLTFEQKGDDPSKIYQEVTDGLACFGGNLLVPRKWFWELGGYDENTRCGLEDGDFGLTLWKHGPGFSYDNRCTGKHTWHPIPKSRHVDIPKQIIVLNKKHFPIYPPDVEKEMDYSNPDYGIISKSKEFYAKQGVKNWSPPPEWEK